MAFEGGAYDTAARAALARKRTRSWLRWPLTVQGTQPRLRWAGYAAVALVDALYLILWVTLPSQRTWPGFFDYAGMVLSLVPLFAVWFSVGGTWDTSAWGRRAIVLWAGATAALPLAWPAAVALRMSLGRFILGMHAPGLDAAYRWNLAWNGWDFGLYAAWAVLLWWVVGTRNSPVWQVSWHRSLWVQGAERAQASGVLTGDVVLAQDAETKAPILLELPDRFLHTQVIGPPGTGKTQGVLHPMVVQDLQSPVGITVLEPKGDWVGRHLKDGGDPKREVLAAAEWCGRQYYLVDPGRADSAALDLFSGDIDTAVLAMIAALDRMAGANQREERFFAGIRREVFTEMAKLSRAYWGEGIGLHHITQLMNDLDGVRTAVQEVAKRAGVQLGMETIRIGRQEVNVLISNTPLDVRDPIHQMLQFFIAQYLHPQEGAEWRRHAKGLWTELNLIVGNRLFMRCITPRKGVAVVQMDKLLESGAVLLVNSNEGDLQSMHRALGGLVASYLQQAIARRGSSEFRTQHKGPLVPHIFYVDEFASYVDVQFADFLERARGLQGAAVFGYQSVSQLERYQKGFSDPILASAATKIVYGRLQDDSETFARIFGSRVEVQEEVHGTADLTHATVMPIAGKGQVRQTRRRVGIVSPEMVRFLPAGEALIETVHERTLQPVRHAVTHIVREEDLPPQRPAPLSPPLWEGEEVPILMPQHTAGSEDELDFAFDEPGEATQGQAGEETAVGAQEAAAAEGAGGKGATPPPPHAAAPGAPEGAVTGGDPF